MARLPYQSREQLPEEYQYLMETDAGELNLFRGIGNNPAVLQSYMRWGTVLWEESGIDRRLVELAILATARATDAAYEWHQHVSMGVEFGLEADQLRALGTGDFGDYDSFDNAERAIVDFIFAFVDQSVTQEHISRLRPQFDDRQITGLTMVASHYLATAHIVDAIDIDTKDEFVGWKLENYEE